MFIDFNREDGTQSEHSIVESNNDREQVLRVWLRDTFEMSNSDIDVVIPQWNKEGDIWVDDGEENSYMMIEIS